MNLTEQQRKTLTNDQQILHLLQTGEITVDIHTGTVLDKNGKPRPVTPCPNGYQRVELGKGAESKRYRVHRCVAVAASGLSDAPRLEIHHKNGNKADNRHLNLVYVTRSENIKAAIAAQTFTQHTIRARKFTDEEINLIRTLHRQGWKVGQIARHMNSNRCTVKKWIHEDLIKQPGRVSEYIMVSPKGETYKGKNLSAFCKQMGLVYNSVMRARATRKKMHKGWRIVK